MSWSATTQQLAGLQLIMIATTAKVTAKAVAAKPETELYDEQNSIVQQRLTCTCAVESQAAGSTTRAVAGSSETATIALVGLAGTS